MQYIIQYRTGNSIIKKVEGLEVILGSIDSGASDYKVSLFCSIV